MADPALLRALEDISTINAFFHLEPEPHGPRWRPLPHLWRHPDLLAAEVADVRRRLAEATGCTSGDVEWRVAASAFQQGLASRLLSPVLGAALCHGYLLDAAQLHWDPHRTGPLVLALGAGRAGPAPTRAQELAAGLTRRVLTAVLEPVGGALRAQGRVAAGLLWGNAASALAGAVHTLGGARPERAEEGITLARLLLERGPLAGGGVFVPVAGEGPPAFRRTSCCLYYRLPGRAVCGDCVLQRRPAEPPGEAAEHPSSHIVRNVSHIQRRSV